MDSIASLDRRDRNDRNEHSSLCQQMVAAQTRKRSMKTAYDGALRGLAAWDDTPSRHGTEQTGFPEFEAEIDLDDSRAGSEDCEDEDDAADGLGG